MRDGIDSAVLGWLAGLGAAGAAEIAAAHGLSTRTAHSRLLALERAGLVRSSRLLADQPALFLITANGLSVAGRRDLLPLRVSVSSFLHLLECARAAVALHRTLAPDYAVHAARELRIWERDAKRPLASAEIGPARGGGLALHRPDLVCWPTASGAGELPIAIEVELTVKGAEHLRSIIRAWARCRHVAAVVYYATPPAARAVSQAIADEHAGAHIYVLDLERRGELPLPIRHPG
jgi:hypothetical protein